MTELTHNPLSNPRALLTSLHQAAVQGADPFVRTRSAVREWLNTNAFTTNAAPRIHIVAMGKAAPAMSAGAVAALREIGVSPTSGVVIAAAKLPHDAPESMGGALPAHFEMRVGDHPEPDIGSLAAADVIARKIQEIERGDIALVLISGGATSLCAAPCAELREALGHTMDAQKLIVSLIASLHQLGLAIHDMNAVRRRLLRWGAGRLAVAIAERGASAIPVFAISDVIGDEPAVIGSGPCTPDPFDETDFLALTDAHNLRSTFSRELSVALGISGNDDNIIVPPRPSDSAFSLVTYTVVARNFDACAALAQGARDAGIANVTIIASPLEGESESLGYSIASQAVRAASVNSEAQLIVWGGEPVVRMEPRSRMFEAHDVEQGQAFEFDPEAVYDAEFARKHPFSVEPQPLGGRMQAFALAAALALEDLARDGHFEHAERLTILAAGTDGRDGPTDACGAIVDVHTVHAARQHDRNPVVDLIKFESYRALNAAGALLKTGPTGTNVMDVVACYIAPARVG